MSLLNKIQSKPYETRVKLFWTGLIIAILALGVIWGTVAFTDKPQEQSQKGIISQFKEWFAKARESAEDTILENSEKEPITIISATKTAAGQVLILFLVNNDTDNILTLLNTDELTAPKIISNATSTVPISVATSDGQPFPGKILSRTSLAGSMLIEDPTTTSFTLEFSNLYYEPDKVKFNQSIPITIGVSGQNSNPDDLLPRE